MWHFKGILEDQKLVRDYSYELWLFKTYKPAIAWSRASKEKHCHIAKEILK